jgi:hypothetical protein
MMGMIISNKPAWIDKHLLPEKVRCPLLERGISLLVRLYSVSGMIACKPFNRGWQYAYADA